MQEDVEKNPNNTFVILLGVSGVGKTTIIRKILNTSNDFEYVKPYMTRPLRNGETDKICVSETEFDLMQKNGDFLVVNEHYGYKYGTPKTTVLSVLESGKTPILDYQLSTIKNLYNPEYTLLNIYIKPASIEEWESRLKQSGQYNEFRFELGKQELEKLSGGSIENIDAIVINKHNNIEQTTADILQIINSKLVH